MNFLGATILFLAITVANTLAAPIEHTLESDVTGHPTHLRVELPASYSLQDSRAYPVLYVLDGESNGETARAVAHYLAEIGRAPEMIVVAVDAGPTRAHDYLPASESAEAQGGGGADAFLEFFAEELVVFVDANYRAAPLRLISGHSYGGLFVLHAMANRPGLFAVGLTQSPWLEIELARDVLDAWDSAAPSSGFVFACLGDEPSLAPEFERLEKALHDAAGADFAAVTTTLSGQSHMTTRLLGLYEGLERTFDDEWNVGQARLQEQGTDAIAQRVERLSEKYGYPVLLSASNYQRAVQLGFARGDVAAAKAASDLYVQAYPRSVVAHFLAANVAAATGDRAKALAALDEASRLHELDPRPAWSALAPQIERLRGQLGGR